MEILFSRISVEEKTQNLIKGRYLKNVQLNTLDVLAIPVQFQVFQFNFFAKKQRNGFLFQNAFIGCLFSEGIQPLFLQHLPDSLSRIEKLNLRCRPFNAKKDCSSKESREWIKTECR